MSSRTSRSAAGLAGGPVDDHPLVVQADVGDRDCDSFLPAQTCEGEHHRDIAKAGLEVIERGRQPQHLRDRRDDNPAADRGSPAGTQLEGGVGRDDALLAGPGEQPPEDCSDGALGAAGGGRAVAQGQVADGGVEVRQVEVADPGAAERRQDVDVQAGAFLRQR